MENKLSSTQEHLIVAVANAGEPVELVRGEEKPLLERALPLVRRCSVVLDLGGVRRIDAAGIGVLITLYREAHAAGNRFTVCHAAPRVAGMLKRVGLEELLVSPGAAAPVSAVALLADAAA
jgi:anti-anti-sigma factor